VTNTADGLRARPIEGGAIRQRGLREAFEGRTVLRFDKATDTITDTNSGTRYTPQRQGNRDACPRPGRGARAGPPVTTATVRYHRPAGDYANWGPHLGGRRHRSGHPGAGRLGQTTDPHRERLDHLRDAPINNPQIWLKQGDPTIYTTQPPTT